MASTPLQGLSGGRDTATVRWVYSACRAKSRAPVTPYGAIDTRAGRGSGLAGASVCAVGRLLTAMCRRFAKPSKKATLETSANSHRANARNSIFAGRQKGGKRQHKATANFLCPRKLKIAPPTKTERRPIDSYRILGSCGEHRAELGGRPSRDQCECCLFLKWALRRTKTLLRGGEGNPIPGV